MNIILLIIAFLLSVTALFSQRAYLGAIAIGVLIGFPALQLTTGLRSAIYVQEIVIAAGLVPWLFRDRIRSRESVQSYFVYHQIAIIVYIFLVTVAGCVILGKAEEALVRSIFAALRYGAVALAFIIPASIPLSEQHFISILRLWYAALCGFMLVGVLLSFGVINLGVSTTSIGGEHETLALGFGGFNRISTGTLAQLGIFVTLILARLKRLNIVLGITTVVGFMWLLLASFSRTNLVSLFIFGICLAIFHKGNRSRNILLLVLSVVIMLIFMSYSPVLQERAATVANVKAVINSLETGGRLHGWSQTLNYFFSHPFVALFGAGFDNWSRVLGATTHLSTGHNVYLHAWGELGLIGGSLYLSFFFRLAREFLQAARVGGATGKIGIFAFSLLISLFVAGLTSDILYPTTSMISVLHAIMFLFGIIVGHLRYQRC